MLGFKGKIEYRLLEKCAPHFCRAVNALANFASYSDVGTKTTMGMGQTRRIK
jgi:CRISPR/Cas system endoribonuclease Cas6 (RAMP superfamily)